MVGRRSAPAVSIVGRATLFACRGAGVRAYLSLSLLRRLSGSRRRIRRHAGTRPLGAQAENRPCGPTVSTATRRSLRFSACPALSRSEEHTSELQSLMRISYAVFCLKKKTKKTNYAYIQLTHSHTYSLH